MHSFIIKQEEQSQSITTQYQTCYIVEYFLIKCSDLALRQRSFTANNMKDQFENINMDGILSFFRKIKLHQKL